MGGVVLHISPRTSAARWIKKHPDKQAALAALEAAVSDIECASDICRQVRLCSVLTGLKRMGWEVDSLHDRLGQAILLRG
jgi:hypothetical protein